MSPTLDVLWHDAISNSRLTVSRQTQEKAGSYEDKIQEALGLKFLDEYNAIYDAIMWEQLEHAFELGFRTAFQLWAEVQSSRSYP